MVMKCSNPACTSEKFIVQVEHKVMSRERPDRLPVKLICAHCKKPAKAYLTNTQMKEMLRLLGNVQESLNADLKAILDVLTEEPQKRGLMKRIFGR